MTTFVRRKNTALPAGGVVLGIDASYAGLAIVSMSQDSVATHVRGTFTKVKGPDRLLAIEQWLTMHLRMLPEIHHIAMENYSPGSTFGREKLGELGGLVKMTLRRSVPGNAGFPTLVVPTQLKLFVTGSGKGDKDQVTKEVYRKWGFDSPNNDVADAYGLAKVAQALQWGASGCLVYEQELLSRLTRHTEHPDNDSAGHRATAASKRGGS